MRLLLKNILIACFLLFISSSAEGQTSLLVPADSLNKTRFNVALIGSSALYTGFSIGLYNTWYKQYPQSGFHLFNDMGEWANMDKAGHIYTSYFQGVLCYKGAKWTGLEDNDAILVGAICGSLFQTTIEMMDAFSEKWGFSIGDIAANTIGTSTFVLQQKYWGEQKISFKVSSWPKSYSTEALFSSDGLQQTSLQERSEELFGAGYYESFLKDYNAQIIWASFNINSLLQKENNIPDWLNVAVGYGAENMLGGFENSWESNGTSFAIEDELFPRYKQYYLGLDVDFTRIKTKSPLLKTVFSILNIFKLPLPALEYNSLGNFKLHAFAN